MQTSQLFLCSSLAAVALMGFGCNPTAKIEEKVTESLVKSATGGKVNVDSGGKQVTFKDDKTGESAAYGEDLKLPDDFPKDVPIYSGAKISTITNTLDNLAVTYTVGDVPKVVVDWYANKLKSDGWTQASSYTAEEIDSRMFTKDDLALEVTISKGEESGAIVMVVRKGSDNK